MQSKDDQNIIAKPLSLLSAATIAATTLMGSSVHGADQWKYDDATTNRLTEKVTQRNPSTKSTTTTSTSSSVPAETKPTETKPTAKQATKSTKSINIELPSLPSLPTLPTLPTNLPLPSVEIPDLSKAGKLLEDQKINEKVNDVIKAASDYATTIKNEPRSLPAFDDLIKIYKNPAPYQFSPSSSSTKPTKPLAKAQSLKPRAPVQVPAAIDAVLPKIDIPDFASEKPISIDLPPLDLFKAGGSRLLTTTVQTESKPVRSKTIVNDIGKPTISDAPVINDDYAPIRKQLQSLIDLNKIEWEYVLGVVGLVLVVDAISGQQILRQEKEEKQKVIDKLESDLKMNTITENYSKSVSESAELQSRNKELDAKIASLEGQLAIKSAATDATVSKLNAKITSLESELEKARVSPTVSKVTVTEQAQAPVTDTLAWEKKVAVLQKREEAIVTVLKKFLVEQGYLPQGIANMLLAGTIVETLEKTSATSSATSKVSESAELQSRNKELDAKIASLEGQLAIKSAANDATVSKLNAKITSLESELEKTSAASKVSEDSTSLKKSITKLEKANLELKKTETDAQKYVAQLTAENDELKQKLLLSDERLFELQEQMQSKLDSAKAVAKVLNEKLVDATKPKEVEGKVDVKKATKKEEKKVKEEPVAALKKEAVVPKKEAAAPKKEAAAPKKEAAAPKKGDVPAAVKAKLEFTAGQLQKKTKKELGDLLKTYGIQDIDGVKVDACLKTDIILALEKFR